MTTSWSKFASSVLQTNKVNFCSPMTMNLPSILSHRNKVNMNKCTKVEYKMHSFITSNCYMDQTILMTWSVTSVKFNFQEIQCAIENKYQMFLGEHIIRRKSEAFKKVCFKNDCIEYSSIPQRDYSQWHHLVWIDTALVEIYTSPFLMILGISSPDGHSGTINPSKSCPISWIP